MKFRNADEARKARELEKDWKDLQARHGVVAEENKRKRAMVAETYSTPANNHRQTPKIDSLPFTGGICPKVPDKVYTGNMIKGIGTMHKSNAVPVFNDDHIIEIARMRR